MRAYIGVNKDGRILFGVAETIEDFVAIAKLSNMEDIKVMDVTDVVRSENTNAIEIRPKKLWRVRNE